MKPIISTFGQIEDTIINLYTLTNDHHLTVKITNYGATITSITCPDKNGVVEEIVCGFDQLSGYFDEKYKANAPYFGCTVGRYCSQIKDAKFSLNGKEYQLADNCGPNNLHGGAKGFDKKIWNAEVQENAVRFSTLSQSMEEGFPGDVEVSVTFKLNNDNELIISYEAKPTEDTPIALTNHSYFNLNGFKSTVENHSVQINASKKQVWDETGAATGEIVSVIGAVDDLRNSKKIGDVHAALGDGFEHFYLFDDQTFQLQEVANINCPESGRSLKVSTTEPGTLLYTGKYTADDLTRENGLQYGKFRGFCLETHRLPNGPNIADSPKSITKKGEVFQSTTIFKLAW